MGKKTRSRVDDQGRSCATCEFNVEHREPTECEDCFTIKRSPRPRVIAYKNWKPRPTEGEKKKCPKCGRPMARIIDPELGNGRLCVWCPVVRFDGEKVQGGKE